MSKPFTLQNDFNYNSPYWTNNETYAVEDGLEGLTETQTKLASYWNTRFNKLCLGMKVNGVTRWIVVDHQASSLFNVIGAGNFKATAVGRQAWASLINNLSLQDNCNEQGFNIQKKHSLYQDQGMDVRIGLVANNENDCLSCNSCIGFGTSVRGCNNDVKSTTCGNIMAICGGYNRDIAAFGYVLVQ